MSTDAFADFVVGHGELWSAQLMAACIKQLGGDVRFMDTRDVLVVTPTSDGSSVDLQEDVSNTRLDQWFTKHGTPKVGSGPGVARAGVAMLCGEGALGHVQGRCWMVHVLQMH